MFPVFRINKRYLMRDFIFICNYRSCLLSTKINPKRKLSKRILYGAASATLASLSTYALITKNKNWLRENIELYLEPFKHTQALNRPDENNRKQSKDVNEEVTKYFIELDNYVKAAIIANEEAVKEILEHINVLKDIFENLEEDDWDQAIKANEKREEALRNANLKTCDSKKELSKAENILNQIAKENNIDIDCFNSKLNDYYTSLEESENIICKTKESGNNVYEKFFSMVFDTNQTFEKEMEALLPYINEESPEEAIKVVIAHSKNNVLRLNKRLHKQILIEKENINKALGDQKKEMTKEFNKCLEKQIVDLKGKFDIELSSKIQELTEKHEEELQKNLYRVTATHCKHLQNEIERIKKEQEEKYQEMLAKKLFEVKQQFFEEIKATNERLQNIEGSIDFRMYLDEAAKLAQKLWLSCENIVEITRCGRKNSLSSLPISLRQDFEFLKENALEKDEFIVSLIQNIPEEAVTRGIYSEEYLKKRFEKIDSQCRALTLVDSENNKGLFKYFLSYFQSLLLFDTHYVTEEEIKGEILIDPNNWDVYDILARVKFCLENNNLEQALRYANQLTGRPREIARDWMKELKLLLETQQIVTALATRISSLETQACL